jgi:phenylacetate-CoA ligase
MPLDYLVTVGSARCRRLPRVRVLQMRDRALRRLITHAYENLPYYRRLFDENGLDPRDIRTATDLQAVPVTTKDNLRAVPVEDTVARGLDPRRLLAIKTSGVTGEPFVVRRTRFEQCVMLKLGMRAMRYFGSRTTDKLASVVRMTPARRRRGLQKRFLNAFGVHRHIYVDCCLQPEDILKALRDYGPQVLSGFAGTLAHLVEAVTPADRRETRLRFVAPSGEVLTDSMRDRISKGFGAPVYDRYGSHELTLIAWQCRETGELHTCDDAMIVEVLKDGRPAAPGEQGEIVATNLYAFAMPFIRYRLHDIVTMGSEQCACGEPFSTIRKIEGRVVDYFLLPDGRWMHPYQIVNPLVNTTDWVRRFQLIQERMDRLVLLLVPSRQPSAEELTALQRNAAPPLGSGVKLRIELVPEIEAGPGGKLRVFRPLAVRADRGLSAGEPASGRAEFGEAPRGGTGVGP